MHPSIIKVEHSYNEQPALVWNVLSVQCHVRSHSHTQMTLHSALVMETATLLSSLVMETATLLSALVMVTATLLSALVMETATLLKCS